MDLGASNEAEQDFLEAERAQSDFLDAFADLNVLDNPAPTIVPSDSSTEDHDIDEDPEVVEQAFHDELFHFLPAIPPQDDAMDVDQPGPSRPPRRGPKDLQLDDDDDERYVEEYEGAGRIVRMKPELHRLWQEKFGGQQGREGEGGNTGAGASGGKDAFFAPFASELDWRVACWAVKDGIGHKSFDRFLAIPGVITLHFAVYNFSKLISLVLFKVAEKLGLSYNNTKSLHKKLDRIPERAKWYSANLGFKDRPDEPHLIQYRDPLEAIRSLLGNPTHNDDIVYVPKKIFSNRNKEKRIYNEMWTGKWWHAVQVS